MSLIRSGSMSISHIIASPLVAIALTLAHGSAAAQRAGFDPVLGRWNLTIVDRAAPYPSWLEIRLRTENEIMGRFVGRFGSLRYVTEISFDAGRLEFRVPVQYEQREDDLFFDGILDGDTIRGTTTDSGRVIAWAARRAPSLRRDGSYRPTAPISLIGDNLDGWRMRQPGHDGCWQIEDTTLIATPPCVDLISEAEFDDFLLHLQFRYPPRSNSGVYLRGRYEIQIQDDAGKALDPLRVGGVYGFIAPSRDAAGVAGDWQSLDVSLVGRTVTVILNATTIIEGQEIPGITGGALDSDEAASGPIMLQGDHGPIEFRDLIVTPLE
jgi:hypothetical protein